MIRRAQWDAALAACPQLPEGITFDDLDVQDSPEADAAFADIYRRLGEYRKLRPMPNGLSHERDSDRVISTPDVRRHGRSSWVGEAAYEGK